MSGWIFGKVDCRCYVIECFLQVVTTCDPQHLNKAVTWTWSGTLAATSLPLQRQARTEQRDAPCPVSASVLVTTSASKSSIRRFVITEKAPTRAFSWLKAATTAFTFKTLLRHYAKQTLTPRSLNVKLGPLRNCHKARAAMLTKPPVPYDL